MKLLKIAYAAACVTSLPLFADTVTWKGDSEGDWNVDSNWIDGQSAERVPTADDDVVISGVANVVVSGDAPFKSLTVGAKTDLVISSSGDGQLILPSGDVGIFVSNGSTLDISATVSGNGRLWRRTDATTPGVLRVSGHNTFTGGVLIGPNGNVSETKFAYSDSLGGPDANGVYGTVTTDAGWKTLTLEQGNTTYYHPFDFQRYVYLTLPKTFDQIHFKGSVSLKGNGGSTIGNTQWTAGKVYFDAPFVGYGSGGFEVAFYTKSSADLEMHFCRGLNLLCGTDFSAAPAERNVKGGAVSQAFHLLRSGHNEFLEDVQVERQRALLDVHGRECRCDESPREHFALQSEDRP